MAESSIHSEEEGAVLYLVKNFQQANESVLSLCKLKTLEYRVLRKLREKLRNFILRTIGGHSEAQAKLNSFIDETKKLCSGYNMPLPLHLYHELAD